jgi:hypothetical protein
VGYTAGIWRDRTVEQLATAMGLDAAAPVQCADLACGSARDAPDAIAVTQVVEHGLRRLAWLSLDDPVIGAQPIPAATRQVAPRYVRPRGALHTGRAGHRRRTSWHLPQPTHVLHLSTTSRRPIVGLASGCRPGEEGGREPLLVLHLHARIGRAMRSGMNSGQRDYGLSRCTASGLLFSGSPRPTRTNPAI